MYFGLFVFVLTLVACGIQAKEYVFKDDSEAVCMKMNLTGEYTFSGSVKNLDNASKSTVNCAEDIRTAVFSFEPDQFNLTFQKFTDFWVMSEIEVAYVQTGGEANTGVKKEDNLLPYSVKLGCYFQQDGPLVFNVSGAFITLTNVTIIQAFAQDAGGDFGDCQDAATTGATAGTTAGATAEPGVNSTQPQDKTTATPSGVKRLGVSAICLVLFTVGGALLAY